MTNPKVFNFARYIIEFCFGMGNTMEEISSELSKSINLSHLKSQKCPEETKILLDLFEYYSDKMRGQYVGDNIMVNLSKRLAKTNVRNSFIFADILRVNEYIIIAYSWRN